MRACAPTPVDPETVTLAVSVPRTALTVLAPPPDLLSQRNVEATTGIPARVYLALVRGSGCPLKVTRLGKLRLVDRSAFVEWVRRRTEPPREPEAESDVDVLAAELGLRRTGARR